MKLSWTISALAGAAALAVSACGATQTASSDALAANAALAAAVANPVTVSPLPGTPDASPDTQISVLGEAGVRVLSVSAVGSRSGAHAGRIEAYSTGTGASFLPSRPFRAGERVRVRVRVAKAGGQDATATSTFTVAHEALISHNEFPNNPGNASEVQHYASAPELTPSTLRVTTPAQPGAASGYLFLAPYQGTGSAGPMIVDQQGNLVWFHPLPGHEVATDFQVQQYEGKPVLTWWQGHVLGLGFGQGEDVLYNSSYAQVARIRAGNGYEADLHEIRLTPQGTAWIDAFDPVDMSLASVHGSTHGVLTDSVIQEIDVKTGLVMWEWHAFGHIALSESHNPVSHGSYPWDYIHINSVDPGSSGDVLLSARNSWTLYDVDLHSGGFRWRIGQTHSSFQLGAGVRFYWQHDAEFQPGGLISVFDNASTPPKEKQSRGLLLSPDFADHTVTLRKAFVNSHETLLSESQGNVLALAGGDWLVGYGRLPNLTEYDASGRVLLDATLGKNVQDFRSYFAAWSGQPTTPPALVAAPAPGGGLTVQTSWNGATEVASWRVLAGATPQTLAPVASAAKSGFQTTIHLAAAAPCVAVQALDAAGAVLGTSATISA